MKLYPPESRRFHFSLCLVSRARFLWRKRKFFSIFHIDSKHQAYKKSQHIELNGRRRGEFNTVAPQFPLLRRNSTSQKWPYRILFPLPFSCRCHWLLRRDDRCHPRVRLLFQKQQHLVSPSSKKAKRRVTSLYSWYYNIWKRITCCKCAEKKKYRFFCTVHQQRDPYFTQERSLSYTLASNRICARRVIVIIYISFLFRQTDVRAQEKKSCTAWLRRRRQIRADRIKT